VVRACEGEKRGKEKKKEKRKREKKWDTCPIESGWEEIMLSPPSQPCVDTWQGESPFILKPQLLLITSRPPLY
jgi:hypothetical protein